MSVLEFSHQINGGGAASSGPFYNITHVHSSAPDNTKVSGYSAAFATFYQAIKAIYFTSTTVTVNYKVVAVDATPPILWPSTPTSVVGTGTTGFQPPQVCYVCSWKTLQATRHGRGRIYLGPLCSGVLQSDGRLFTPNATTIQTAGNALIAAIKAVDPADYLAVYNRKTKADVPITSAVCTAQPYTQRRRAL
jgi:hypothetical protein